MDYETNPDGDIKIERVDPLGMYWDHKANQRNISDATWVLRVKPMRISDVKALWPDKADEIEFSHRVIAAFESAEADGRGVLTVDGRMIENLHVGEARRILAIAAAVASLEQS